jgi:ectoine hydroxylase-related dioxygenase (phytanoyl-CoA dioxygenase family)
MTETEETRFVTGCDLQSDLRGVEGRGYVLFEGFAEPSLGKAMLEDVIGMARSAAAGEKVEGFVMEESQPNYKGQNPEDRVSKIFKLHRRPVFRTFLRDPRIAKILVEAIGPDVDCFLSQFIFKNPGAWGQPWHQDSYYFPFEPARPIVAMWLAITEATLDNGCLHVLPGSQAEPVHEHISDRREGALYGYVEIVDHDMELSQTCQLMPGDLLVFDSHLMHRSTDNISSTIRAAMVWHFAIAGTVDLGMDFGSGKRVKSPIHDWMPLLRTGDLVDTI